MNYFDEIKRIWLLVECSSSAVKLETYLEQAGFRLNRAMPEPGQVKEFLERNEDFNPGVVIMQAGYSGYDTFDLCRQLKADHRLKPIPLVIFGCENHPQNAVRAFRAGAEYYVALAGEDFFSLLRLVENLAHRRARFAWPTKGQN